MRRICLLLISIVGALFAEVGAAMPAQSVDSYLFFTSAALAAQPTTGSAWSFLKTRADGTWPTLALSNQDSQASAYVFAGAVAYARTGNAAYKTKVDTVLASVPSQALTGSNAELSVSRQLPGLVLAADLTGYRDPTFVQWVSDIRTRHIGTHGRWTDIKRTTENTCNNWGSWALASRAVASRYLNDTADVAKVDGLWTAIVNGDRNAYEAATDLNTWGNYFQKTADFDQSWAHSTTWWCIDPLSSGAKSGITVEEASRSAGAYPNIDSTGKMYSWESINAWQLVVRALEAGGYPDAAERGDSAFRRLVDRMAAWGDIPPQYDVSNHAVYTAEKLYGIDYPQMSEPARHGRTYGFTDWLP